MQSIYLPHQQYRPPQGKTRRSFVPFARRYGRPTFPISKLVKYSPKWKYSRLYNFPRPGLPWLPRMNTIVIQVHGIATPNSSTEPNSHAAGGVYFGPGAPHNLHFSLPGHMDQTNNRAILEAIRTTLNELVKMRHTELDPRFKEVIIMTNSGYAKQSLSQWVWEWEQNGWNHMRRNELIKHVEVMQEIHNLLTYIETTLNMAVRFWKVSREDIAGADELAKMAMRNDRGVVVNSKDTGQQNMNAVQMAMGLVAGGHAGQGGQVAMPMANGNSVGDISDAMQAFNMY